MSYILVGEVSHPVDGVLLDSPLIVLILDSQNANTHTSCLVFSYYLGFVEFHLLHIEGCAYDVHIMACVFAHLVFLVGMSPHGKDIRLLQVPYVALSECAQ